MAEWRLRIGPGESGLAAGPGAVRWMGRTRRLSYLPGLKSAELRTRRRRCGRELRLAARKPSPRRAARPTSARSADRRSYEVLLPTIKWASVDVTRPVTVLKVAG